MSIDPDRLASSGLRTGHLSDAMDELGLPCNAGGGYRHAGCADRLVVGRAVTICQAIAPDGEPIARQGEIASSIARAGDVIVIDASGVDDIVTWGEAHTLRAMASGVRGVVVDGCVRDVEGLDKRGLPVLYRDTSPIRSKGRLHTVSVNAPVELRGVKVSAGDCVAADSDGIVVIRPQDTEAVFAKAFTIFKKESRRDAELERSAGAGMLGDASQ